MRPDHMGEKITKVFTQFSRGDIRLVELTRYAAEIGLRNKSGKNLTLNQIMRLLRNPAYAGYVCDGLTDYERVIAKHEPLVHEKTFALVQYLLDKPSSRKRTAIKKRNDRYFLKRLLLCHVCEKPLYASAPKTGGGGHSERYHCPRCKGSAKSVKVAIVHDAFANLLADIQPGEGILRLYKEILVRQAAIENNRLNTRLKQKRQELDELGETRLRAIEQKVNSPTKSERDEISELITRLDKRKLDCQGEITELERSQTLQEQKITAVVENMHNLQSIWLNGGIEMRFRFQNLLFPEGLILNTKTMQFGTYAICPLYRYVSNKKDLSPKEKSLLVAPRGIEPLFTH